MELSSESEVQTLWKKAGSMQENHHTSQFSCCHNTRFCASIHTYLWCSHFLWAGCIWWFPKSSSILQQLSECERVHSSIGDFASCENLPACHTKGPLQKISETKEQ